MGALLLFITTFIWGTAFLAQKIGGEHLGPFAMTVFRNILGGVFLLGLIVIKHRRFNWWSVMGGIGCGVPLFLAMLTQQIGIKYTMPGISAFLTTNYVFFVPIIQIVLTHRMPKWYIWVGVALALTGTYFICQPGQGFRIGVGETWTLLCAFLFAVQMMAVDCFAPKCDILVMSAIQLFTCGVIGAPFLLLDSEVTKLQIVSFKDIWMPIVYCGVFSSGIAYTLQNVGQAKTPPATAAIVLSLESVFGALAGWFFLGDILRIGQLCGCAIVFIAVIIAQIAPILGKRS